MNNVTKMPTSSRYSKGNRQSAGSTPTDKNEARRAGAKKTASAKEAIGKVKQGTLTNKNSIKGTSSDPKMKNNTKIGQNPAKGVNRAKSVNAKKGAGIVGGFQVARGGGATPATTKYNPNQLSVGAIQASNAQPRVKFGKATVDKNNGGAKPAKVRKTQ